jgi:hypothetical protein
MENKFLDTYGKKISGFISCYDRVIISGSLNIWGYKDGMFSYLMRNNIRIMDFAKFGKEYTDKIRENIKQIVKTEGIEIENIRNPGKFDKEKDIKTTLQNTNKTEGIIKIYSSMELSSSYESHWNEKTRKVSLNIITPKILNYYIYFLDRSLGLCFIRIPTWLPCRIQFYFNGHNYLAYKLKKHKIDYQIEDNAFVYISDYETAQKLSDDIRAKELHEWLDKIIKRYIPFLEQTGQNYRWTILQSEYSSDIIFKNKNDLRLLYEELSINSIHCVKPENIATFFSRALSAQYQGDVGTKYNKKIHATRIKHYMGANSIKMYDKASVVLRIETTINDIYQLPSYREVVTRTGEKVKKQTIMKKSIYSLFDLGKFCKQSNFRYIEFISSYDCNLSGKNNLLKISEKIYQKERSYKGFNFFDSFDLKILLGITSGEFNINGFRNKSLRNKLNEDLSSSAVSRILKRLRLHGLIKKVKNTFKYYLTTVGKRIIAVSLILKEKQIIPALS